MADPRVIVVPQTVAATLLRLRDAIGKPFLLLGGWAVHSRLVLANRRVRPTEDIDIGLHRDLRPARAALEAIDAIQDDPRHTARLSGLPVMVDLLADDPEEAVKSEPGLIRDPDGLNLMVPPFADLLALGVELIELHGADSKVTIMLPTAGSLFASKIGCLHLEFRLPEKKASDGLDALALLEAYGPSNLDRDLAQALRSRRALLAERLENVGYSGLAAQARAAGGIGYPDGIVAVPSLVRALRDD